MVTLDISLGRPLTSDVPMVVRTISINVNIRQDRLALAIVDPLDLWFVS